MTTPFENFVNTALGKSVSADVTLPTANEIPVFTGIGRQVTGKTKAELGLALTADLDTDGTLAANSDTKYPSQKAVKTYADSLLTSVYKFQSTYNPQTTGNFPTTANTVGGVGIAKCFTWVIAGLSGQYTFQGVTVDNGDTLLSLVDNASATVSSDWHITEKNLGYTPENLNNKATNLSSPNDTKYPTTKAIVDNVLSILLTNYTVAIVNSTVSATDSSLTAFGKLQKQITDAVASAVTQSSLRYLEVPKSGATLSIDTADVTPTGSKLVVLTHSSAIACSLDTPANLGKTTGDSVNIIQGGAGTVTVTLTGGVFVGAKTTSTTAVYSFEGETKTFVAINTTDWRVIGG